MPPIIENISIIPQKFQASFKKLSEKIKNLVKVTVCKPLSGGFSDSIPLFVYADYERSRAAQVFKIGRNDTIDREAQNWDLFIRNGPYPSQSVIHLKESIQGSPDSLIIYNFAGSPNDVGPVTFKDHYDSDRLPEAVLTQVFERILKLHSYEIRRETSHPTVQTLLSISQKHLVAIEANVKKLTGRPDIASIPRLQIGGDPEALLNPLCFYPFGQILPEPAPLPVPQGVAHGDLNAMNILLYQTEGVDNNKSGSKPVSVEIPCVIDYAFTGIHSLYTDLAKMESVLKFELLKSDAIDEPPLLQFEKKNVLHELTLSKNPSIKDDRLQKLFAVLDVVRESAARIVEGGYDPMGYWLELYKNTLQHIRYDNTTDSQKRYALASAALLLTKHLAK